ncbi:MAG: hypothetical protein AAF802_11190 [Planctomycetota bacterium]
MKAAAGDGVENNQCVQRGDASVAIDVIERRPQAVVDFGVQDAGSRFAVVVSGELIDDNEGIDRGDGLLSAAGVGVVSVEDVVPNRSREKLT